MQEKPSSSHTLGLELCGKTVRAVALSRNSKGPKLDWTVEVPVEHKADDKGSGVKLLYIGQQKKLMETLVNKNLVVTALPTRQTLIRPLHIKLKKIADVDAALHFQAEPILPYPIDNAIIDRIILGKNKEGVQLTVAAARKDYLASHIDFWESLDIEPEVISCTPQALAVFSGEQENAHFSIHVSFDDTTCALVNNKKLIAAKSIRKGVNDLFFALQKDDPAADKKTLQELDFSNIDKNDHPSLVEELIQFNLEITRIIFSQMKALKGEEVGSLMVTGEVALLHELDSVIAQHLEKKLIDPEPRPQITIPLKEQKAFALPIGMALTALNGAADQINFRQGDLAYPHPWKRVKKPVMTYITLSLLLALLFYMFTNVYIGYEQDRLKEQYAELLGFIKKPYNQFENEFNAKQNRGSDGDEVDVVSLKEITNGELEERLVYIQKQISEAPDTFPLLPQVPRVSDVLSWLSTHDVIIGPEGKTGATLPRIQLEKFNYKVVKRPQKSKQNEKYQVKVDLEFQATTPTVAREFHDALLVPNPMIDLKNEVKWSSSRGKYKASFYLKDKTNYYKVKKS